jgi:hypothetical protein
MKVDVWEVTLYSPQHGDYYKQNFEFPANTNTFKVISSINNAGGGSIWKVGNLRKIKKAINNGWITCQTCKGFGTMPDKDGHEHICKACSGVGEFIDPERDDLFRG